MSSHHRLLSLEQVSKPCKGYLNLEQETKSTMTKESGRKTVLLHSDSSESEKRNQLALIESQLFVDPVQNEETGEVTVSANKISNDVRFMATALMAMKETEPPSKEVVKAFLASERKCTLDNETRERLCTILDNDDQDVPSFTNMETPPRRTDPSTRDGEGQLSAASKSKVKTEQKSRSDSSDSEEEEVKRSPAGEVTTPSKMEKRKALFLLLKASPESEAQAKVKQLNVQDEVKRLAPGLAKLNWNEWMAIVGHYTFTKESMNEQKKTELIMDAVDSRLHTWFKIGESKFSATHLMIDLYENCYGRGDSAIERQQKNVEALVKTLKDQTVMGPYSKQLKMEYEIVYAHLEHVYGGPHKKPFLELELCQKITDQVGTFDKLLARELARTVAHQEANQQTVTLNMVLQMIEREQGVLSIKSPGVSSEASEAPADKLQGKNLGANRAETNFQKKCHICGSENHLQNDCPRGNQKAIEAGKAAAPQSGKASKGGVTVSQGEDQREKGNNQISGRKEPCKICTSPGFLQRTTNTHVTADCKHLQQINQSLQARRDDKRSGHRGDKDAEAKSGGQQSGQGVHQATKAQSEGSNQVHSSRSSLAMGPSGWGFGQVAGSFGQPMTPMYAMHNAPQQAAGPWSSSGMKQANSSQTTFGATVPFESLQQGLMKESRPMPRGTNQSPTMQNTMTNVGAPGPFQSAFSMFPVQYRASDQGLVMGGANQQNNKPLDGAGGEGHVSHSAMLTHAE